MSAESTIVLITGANSGIGLAAAKVITAASSKYHVIMASRSKEKGSAALEAVRTAGSKGTISALQLDVTDEASIKAAAKSVESEFGRIDALVNNAGVYCRATSVKEHFETTLAANLIGAAVVADIFTPLLLKSSKPYILHISSSLGSLTLAAKPAPLDTWPGARAYRASKAGLNMLAVEDAKTLESHGGKAFAVCPGLVESGLRGDNEEARTFGGKAGDPAESGRTILSILEGERDADNGKFVVKDGLRPW